MSAFQVFLFWISLCKFFLFLNTLLTLLWSLAAWIPASALLSCLRKQSQLAFWRPTFVYTSSASWMSVCIHCFDGSLISTFANRAQDSSAVIRTMWLRSPRHLRGVALIKSNAKPFSAFCAQPEYIRNSSCTKHLLAYPNCREECVKFVEIQTKVLKLWSAVVHRFLFNTTDGLLTILLFIANICSPTF
jgi:hypothetical protein